jgi:hypothetical protein
VRARALGSFVAALACILVGNLAGVSSPLGLY